MNGKNTRSKFPRQLVLLLLGLLFIVVVAQNCGPVSRVEGAVNDTFPGGVQYSCAERWSNINRFNGSYNTVNWSGELFYKGESVGNNCGTLQSGQWANVGADLPSDFTGVISGTIMFDGIGVFTDTIQVNCATSPPPTPTPAPECIITDIKGNFFFPEEDHWVTNPVTGQVTNLSQNPACQDELYLLVFGTDTYPEDEGWLEGQQHTETFTVTVPPGTIDMPITQTIDTSEFCWYQVDLLRTDEVRHPPYFAGEDMVDYVFVEGTAEHCFPEPDEYIVYIPLILSAPPAPEPCTSRTMTVTRNGFTGSMSFAQWPGNDYGNVLLGYGEQIAFETSDGEDVSSSLTWFHQDVRGDSWYHYFAPMNYWDFTATFDSEESWFDLAPGHPWEASFWYTDQGVLCNCKIDMQWDPPEDMNIRFE